MGFYGALEDLPLQDILYVLSSRGKSGRLTLNTKTNEFILLLDKGRVAAVTTNDDNLRIGRLLVDQGYVSEEQMEQALALQEVVGQGTRIGDLLVGLGFVDRREIGQAVAAQFEASLFRVLLHPSGTFAFEPEETIRVDPLMDEIPIELMILNAVRMADEWQATHAANEFVTLQDIWFEPSKYGHLGDREKRVLIAILNGARTSRDLAKSTGIPAPDLRETLSKLSEFDLIVRTQQMTPKEELARSGAVA